MIDMATHCKGFTLLRFPLAQISKALEKYHSTHGEIGEGRLRMASAVGYFLYLFTKLNYLRNSIPNNGYFDENRHFVNDEPSLYVQYMATVIQEKGTTIVSLANYGGIEPFSQLQETALNNEILLNRHIENINKKIEELLQSGQTFININFYAEKEKTKIMLYQVSQNLFVLVNEMGVFSQNNSIFLTQGQVIELLQGIYHFYWGHLNPTTDHDILWEHSQNEIAALIPQNIREINVVPVVAAALLLGIIYWFNK
ncbi:hypothetical protein [Endozoicomonas sp. OPT23]|uniref:hypothetical protein n=1 Tax=Endozoicomonas sp. OPT23 TaxID=2072845 RepID=UPI00129AA299|nr:hypothetical protein [Endozoicomonas sp. OPT23]